MIIDYVPYVALSDDVNFSISASIWMLLSQAGYKRYTPEDINEMFCDTFLSQEFHDNFRSSLHIKDSNIPNTVGCALYLVNEMLQDIRASIFQLDLPAIKYSFIKRHIPVMITGTFPVKNDSIQNSIVVKGYVDDYFVVNDPRGDAYSKYKDTYGENHLYKISDIEKWTGDAKVFIFRIHK